MNSEDDEFKRIEREIAERIEREATMQFVNCGNCGEKLGDVHTCTPQPAPVPEQPAETNCPHCHGMGYDSSGYWCRCD